jgi:hypothetical protein
MSPLGNYYKNNLQRHRLQYAAKYGISVKDQEKLI